MDARQDSRHEHLADDTRDRAELSEWERVGQVLAAAVMPEPVVETPLTILGDPTPAERRISPDVEQVLGRAPRTFADWAQRHIAAPSDRP